MPPARSAFFPRRPIGSLALTALLALTAIASSRADVILVDDQFIDGAVSNGADALDASWTSSQANNGLSVGAFAGSGNTTNALIKTNTNAGNTFNVMKGAFTNTIALASGDSITLSFDFRFTTTPAASNAGLRIGLGTSATSTLFQLGTGGSASGNFVYYTTADTGAGTAAGTFASDPVPSFSISDTASHSFSLTFTRTGATSMSLSTTIDGNTFTSVSGATSITAFTFDRILVGEGSAIMKYNIDNVLVSLGAIPEPSDFATFAGLAAFALASRRRRHAA